MFTLHDAIGLATWGHRHQTDKAGLPYIEHPLRVLASVQAQGALPYVQMAAVLHDLTEDQPFTDEMLKILGVPEPAVEIINLLDRNRNEKIFHSAHTGEKVADSTSNGRRWYTSLGADAEDEFYYGEIRKNFGAAVVKMADVEDNSQQWRLSYLPVETQDRMVKKYNFARRCLIGTPNGKVTAEVVDNPDAVV